MPPRAEAWEEADLLYPDDLVTEDDTPVDSIFSEKQQRLLTGPLEICWPGPGKGRPFVVLANVGLFYSLRKPPLVPDVMLSLDVRLPADLWAKRNRAYFIREYGKPPEIAIEIVSTTKEHEASGKMCDYAHAGVRYYAIFDPEQCLSKKRMLHLYELHGTGYIETARQQFPEIGLGLTVWNGVYTEIENAWLRWCDRNGKLIATGAECMRAEQAEQRAEQENMRAEQAKQRAEQAEQRAEQESMRAEQAKQRAEQAKQRTARLVEKLRKMGIDPDKI
ncbi:MAG: Uma2 family endonuclease [Gammaproteobacteria bacterium]|nr:Uma2 family endonuclease [Gammaproteobacteria bacterium]